MYCIAEFAGVGDRREVAVVHKSWVHGNKCYWPSFWRQSSRLQKALKTGELPNPQEWFMYEIRVIGNRYFGTYDEARRHLEIAQNQSDLSSDEINSRTRKRNVEDVNPSSSSGSEDDAVLQSNSRIGKSKKPRVKAGKEFQLPSPPVFPAGSSYNLPTPTLVAVSDLEKLQASKAQVLEQPPNSPNTTTEGNIQVVSTSQPPFANPGMAQSFNDLDLGHHLVGLQQSIINSVPSPMSQPLETSKLRSDEATNYDHVEYFRRSQTNQELILAKLDILIDLCRTILQSRDVTTRKINQNITLKLPFSDLNEFRAYDNEMRTDSNLRNDLVSILSTTGGRNGNQVVYRVMAELMTDDLMLLHTFKGQTGKEAFKNTLFFSCVCDAVKQQSKGASLTKKEIEDAIDYWLRKSATRIQKKQKRQGNVAEASEADLE